MPIYEFYCPDCHTVFSFFSSRIDTAVRPACPQCGKASWVGCGRHVEQVLAGVAAKDRCQCPRPAPGKGWLSTLFGR
jgi:putative FmdB family regulatory protein